MKVLEISHLYPVPYDSFLGIAMHKQIRTLSDKGCEVKVLSPIAWAPPPIKYMSNKWKLYSEVRGHEIMDGIEVFHPRYLVFPRAFFLASSGVRLYRGIKSLIAELHREFAFDIVHAHMALPDGYAGMLISQEYNVPLVVTLQATDLDITAKRNTRCLQALEKVFAQARRVISPSPRLTQKLYQDYNISPITIGYGIDPSEIHLDNIDLRDQYGSRRLLLSVSRLISTKGIELNLHALKRLVPRYNDLLYLIVGDGPLRHDLERLTENLGLERYVRFLGQCSHQHVMKYMASCDVFTLPSWQETFGLVYIEAIGHAKPVIGVQGQGVDGIVEHRRTGLLVKPRDVDSLVEALDFLLSHPEEARAMGERARKLVLEKYTWEKNAEKTIRVYEEALNEC